jgi:hypothetical protein
LLTPSQMMLTALFIVTGPKSPGVRQSISPFAAVLVSAPAKVKHGEVMMPQELPSAPPAAAEATQVRSIVAAPAGTAQSVRMMLITSASACEIFIVALLIASNKKSTASDCAAARSVIGRPRWWAIR